VNTNSLTYLLTPGAFADGNNGCQAFRTWSFLKRVRPRFRYLELGLGLALMLGLGVPVKVSG